MIKPPPSFMPRRRFGRTELAMPVFSCGGMRYQKSWSDESWESIPPENQKNLEETVLRAVELGINHIETARGYGTSEMQLGRLLPRLPREELIIQTKVSPQDDKAAFLSAFDRSLELLGVEYVDLLGIHGINNTELLDKTLRPDGALAAARQIQREGRARHIGFSTHGPLEVILPAIETGEFDYVNLHWYFVNEINTPALEAAQRHDMGLFIISPSDKGGKLYAPPEKLSLLCAPLSPMQFNDLYCLARPDIHTLSIGAARPGDFDDHVAALRFYHEAAATVAPVVARLRAAMVEALGAEWMAHWAEGIPPLEEIPGEVNVYEIIRLWNFSKGLDMSDFGKMRYNLLGNAGHWFPGQNASHMPADSAPFLAALKEHRFADRLPALLAQAHELLFEAPVERLSQSE